MQKLTLVQRLCLLLLFLTTLTIAVALIANLVNARHYLEQQLTAHDADTANVLALMLTQYKADPVMTQALLNTTFKQGHFSEIRLDRPRGNLSIRLHNIKTNPGAPAWFRHVFSLSPQTGYAQVSKTWSQAGRVVVISDAGYAYGSLWRGATQTVFWLGIVGLLALLLGWLDIRIIRRQLRAVVGQAQELSEQRFAHIPVPGIPELAQVARAMNEMVSRLQNFLLALRDEADVLRKEVLTDQRTKLPNREAFQQYFASLLAAQDEPVEGYLLLVRVAGLAELNQRMGSARVDGLLARVASDLAGHCQGRQGWMAARLRGADFALVCPELEPEEAYLLAKEVSGLWTFYQSMALTDQIGVGHIGIVAFHSGEAIGEVLSRASQALAGAEAQTLNTWKTEQDVTDSDIPTSDLDWKHLIEQSCQDGALKLRWYPVCQSRGGIVWHEGMLFLPAFGSRAQMSALRLLSQAQRLGLVQQLDLNALSVALNQGPSGVLAINMSPISLSQPTFLPQVLRLLQKFPERKINFEFHETGLDACWNDFMLFSRAVRAAGHQLALEIQGHNMALVARAYEADISYLVLDSVLTRGIAADEGRRALLSGLIKMATVMGVQLEAKGINTLDDVQALIDMGVGRLTGPAISQTPSFILNR